MQMAADLDRGVDRDMHGEHTRSSRDLEDQVGPGEASGGDLTWQRIRGRRVAEP